MVCDGAGDGVDIGTFGGVGACGGGRLTGLCGVSRGCWCGCWCGRSDVCDCRV